MKKAFTNKMVEIRKKIFLNSTIIDTKKKFSEFAIEPLPTIQTSYLLHIIAIFVNLKQDID